MGEIKNIIFDLGGVILNIDYRLTEQAFKRLGCIDFDTKYSQARQLPLFDDFEIGKITSEEFIERLKKLLELNVSNEKIAQAWNAMLIDLPAQRLELLKKLKQTHRTFLLSNTNEIHINAFEKIIFKQHTIQRLEPFFEKTYYSSRIGMRKPNANIFEFVLKENNLKAQETLFVDDSIQHVEGAAKCGIQAKLLPKGEDISVLLNKITA